MRKIFRPSPRYWTNENPEVVAYLLVAIALLIFATISGGCGVWIPAGQTAWGNPYYMRPAQARYDAALQRQRDWAIIEQSRAEQMEGSRAQWQQRWGGVSF